MKQKNKGFTLIEIMIVIIIIAVLSFYLITQKREKAEAILINRTLVEIKNWQEAALLYYAKNKRWPNSLDELVNQRYFLSEAICSPWPGNGSVGNLCPNKMSYRGEITSSFYYTTLITVPSAGIAKQIASKLPQAEVVSTTVKSSVGIPAYYSGGIMSAGIRQKDGIIRMPNCPDGYEGHYIEAPQYYTTGYDMHPRNGSGVNIEFGYDDVRDPTNKPWVYSYIHVHSPDQDVYDSAYYMTFCVAVKQWKPSSYAALSGKQRQCSSDWQNYNGPFSSRC